MIIPASPETCGSNLESFITHDLFAKPVPTFADHAVGFNSWKSLLNLVWLRAIHDHAPVPTFVPEFESARGDLVRLSDPVASTELYFF